VTDMELMERMLARMSFKTTRLVDQRWKKGIQFRVHGMCANGNDEISFTTRHRDTDEECAADVLEWFFARFKNAADSPEKRCGGGFGIATSRQELELKLEAEAR